MIQILFIALLVSSYPTLAQEVLSDKDRWYLGENLQQGDYFKYLTCVQQEICFYSTLTFTSLDNDGIWTINVVIQDALGYYIYNDAGHGDRVLDVTGDMKQDLSNINYVDDVSDDISDDASFTFFINDFFEVSTISPDKKYADAIRNGVMFFGGVIRVGSGTILDHPAILDVGEEWTITRDVDIIVKSIVDGYEFESLKHTGDLYHIEYSSHKPVMYGIILDEFPFPISGKVIADSDVLRRDTYVAKKIWFQLVDTNKDGFEHVTPTLEDAIDTRPVSTPSTDTPTIPIINDTIQNITDSIKASIDTDDLYELFLDWMSDIVPQESDDDIISITTNKESYYKNDDITFSGISKRISANSDTAIIHLSVNDKVFTSIPISIRHDGVYTKTISTESWKSDGFITAQLVHGSDNTSMVFEFLQILPNISDDISNIDDKIHYITDRTVHDITVFPDSIIIFLEQGNDTSLQVQIPRNILDSKDAKNIDSPFTIHVNSDIIQHVESSNSTARILDIDLTSAAEIVEIVVDNLPQTPQCSGNARCIQSTLVKVIDGDTIKIKDDQNVRFALSSAPEISQLGGKEAREIIQNSCGIGSNVLIDEDDYQTAGSYGRIVAMVYCNGINLNNLLMDSGFGYIISTYCLTSEFSKESWARC